MNTMGAGDDSYLLVEVGALLVAGVKGDDLDRNRLHPAQQRLVHLADLRHLIRKCQATVQVEVSLCRHGG
jgi:hypothetical protein